MKHTKLMMTVALAIASRILCAGGGEISAVSPDGGNEIRLSTGPTLSYSVYVRGVPRLVKAPLALAVEGFGAFGGPVEPVRVETSVRSGTLATPVYKKSEISLAAVEKTVYFAGGWAVRIVARDDGVAYRFETDLPEAEVRVTNETAVVEFAAGCERVFASYSRSVYRGDRLQCSWESIPEIRRPDAVFTGNRKDACAFAPLVAEFRDGVTVAVLESDVRDYPGLNYRGDGGRIAGVLAREPLTTVDCDWGAGAGWLCRRVASRGDCLVRTSGRRAYPWRVFAVASRLAKLPENDAVYALASPCALGDVSWIRPGKVAWDWWNGINLTGVDFRAGSNTESYLHFIDFAAEYGLEYVIVDLGYAEKDDPMKPLPAMDLRRVLARGREKGVGVMLWSPWTYLEGRQREIFAHYAAMGVKGFKIDGLDRDDARLQNFLAETAAIAAEFRLVLDFHGAPKPTGLCRTYPNVLNNEGVYGLENCRWAKYDNAANDLAITYVRMTAGALDYTPGGFRNETTSGFTPDGGRPRCRSTRVHQMALVSHFEAPLQMLCDSPSLYRRERECFGFIAKIPTVWDETVGLAGDARTFSAIARRRGKVWYVSAIGDARGGDFELPLGFLGADGEWRAEVFRDGVNADRDATDYRYETLSVGVNDSLKFRLAPNGGFIARLAR